MSWAGAADGRHASLSAFRAAAMRDDIAAMAEIARADPSFIADENPDGVPLARLARIYRLQTFAREGTLADVERALDQDPDLIHEPWTARRWLPLSQAIWGGRHDIVERLIARGAEVRATVDGGVTMLAMAAARHDARVAALLRAHGAG
ncbi:MAG TPA: hypothetical protein VEL07_04560 [Planctomycetota bacterium]|nr:hypothetical protein [Planctomycetota bacterium]